MSIEWFNKNTSKQSVQIDKKNYGQSKPKLDVQETQSFKESSSVTANYNQSLQTIDFNFDAHLPTEDVLQDKHEQNKFPNPLIKEIQTQNEEPLNSVDCTKSESIGSERVNYSRVPKPKVNLLRSIQIEASGQLINRKDLEKKALINLIQEQHVLLPSKVLSQNSRIKSSHHLSFIQDEELITVYEYLQAQLNADDLLDESKSISHLLIDILSFLKSLEEAGSPVIDLNHEQLFFDTKRKSFQVLCTTESTHTWPVLAANLLSHCLLLCGDMGSETTVTPIEHIDSGEVLLSAGLLEPKELRVLQRALNGQYQQISVFIKDLKTSSKFSTRSQVSDPSLTHWQINDIERIAVQKVGQHKYQKKAKLFLSTDLQQEDRYFDTSFIINGERYWCAAVFDGVSTCDFSSGAEIAETCRVQLQRTCGSMQYSKELIRALDRHQDPAIILDYLTQHLIKAVKVKLDELKSDLESSSDSSQAHKNLAIPTSTMTMVLINDRGQAWFKWLGDSPALIINDKAEIHSLLSSHSLKNHMISEGEYIETALLEPNKNALVADIGHLSINDKEHQDDPYLNIGQYACTLQKDETLILCSDGLIDGFKVDAPMLGAEVYALDQIEIYLKEQSQKKTKNLYQLINQLCVQADIRNGVDNITAIALKPHWLKAK